MLELPKDPPQISGGLKSYQLGDRLELNCTSERTYPPTALRWILNGKEVLLFINIVNYLYTFNYTSSTNVPKVIVRTY